jgi:hypothetical protein
MIKYKFALYFCEFALVTTLVDWFTTGYKFRSKRMASEEKNVL